MDRSFVLLKTAIDQDPRRVWESGCVTGSHIFPKNRLWILPVFTNIMGDMPVMQGVLGHKIIRPVNRGKDRGSRSSFRRGITVSPADRRKIVECPAGD